MQFDQLGRREFITLLGGAATTRAMLWPRNARAQNPDGMRRIGVIKGIDEKDPAWQREAAAFLEELKKFGWTEGANLRIDNRSGGGEANLSAMAAKELVALNPHIILAQSTPVVRALLQETRTIPIVFTSVSDPIGENFVASFPRPGGNATGFTNMDATMGGKWVGLLRELAPSIKRLSVLFNPAVATAGGSFYLRPIEAAAGSFSLAVETHAVRSVAELQATLAKLEQITDGGLLVMPDPFTNVHRASIIAFADRRRLPAIYAFRNIAAEGGLISYGVDNVDLNRRAASYVDRILRGERPAELPIQAPTKFDLVINLKSARALGLTVPDKLLALADEVIE